MEVRLSCAESLRVQAYFDGELDALTAAEIERHVEHCPLCREQLRDLGQQRLRVRRDLTPPQAPAALRSQIMRALDREDGAPAPRKPAAIVTPWRSGAFWVGAFSGLGVAAVAASLAFALLVPGLNRGLLDDLVADHVRSLMSSHLIDVESSDRHTVKPWFAGHADVSPAVADFVAQGYRLVGGRADYLARGRAAVLVYQHGPHIINVFTWAAGRGGLPADTSRNGYHMAFWQVGDLDYCAVSDTGWDELKGLERLLRDLGERER